MPHAPSGAAASETPKLHIPIRLHGDDVAVNKTTKVLALTLMSLFAGGAPKGLNNMLLFAVPMNDLQDGHRNAVRCCGLVFRGPRVGQVARDGSQGQAFARTR